MFTPGASFDGVLVLSSLKKIGEVAVLLVVLEKQIFFWLLVCRARLVKDACPQQTLKVTENIRAIASKLNSTGSLMVCIFQ